MFSNILENAGDGGEDLLAKNNIGAVPWIPVSSGSTRMQSVLTIPSAFGCLQLEVALSLFPHVGMLRVACASGISRRVVVREAPSRPKKR